MKSDSNVAIFIAFGLEFNRYACPLMGGLKCIEFEGTGVAVLLWEVSICQMENIWSLTSQNKTIVKTRIIETEGLED